MERPPCQPGLFQSSGEPPLSENESAHTIALGDRIVPYVLHRSRRKTIMLAIDHRGLKVGAPRRETLAAVNAFILRNENWVARKLDEWRASRRSAPIKIAEGSRLPVLDKTLLIHVVVSNANQLRWAEPFPSSVTLLLKSPSDAARVLEQGLRERALALFTERLAFFAARLSLHLPPLSLSDAKTRWGSCSLKTGIRLNWRLLHLPLRLIDYVVVHELTHLFEMNHGQRFWAILGSVLPDYRALRGELKKVACQAPYAMA